MIAFSPTVSAMILQFAIDNVLPLSNRPKTAIFRLQKKIGMYQSVALRETEVIQDAFEDGLDVISQLHLCQYNVCVLIYVFLLLYVIYRSREV